MNGQEGKSKKLERKARSARSATNKDTRDSSVNTKHVEKSENTVKSLVVNAKGWCISTLPDVNEHSTEVESEEDDIAGDGMQISPFCKDLIRLVGTAKRVVLERHQCVESAECNENDNKDDNKKNMLQHMVRVEGLKKAVLLALGELCNMNTVRVEKKKKNEEEEKQPQESKQNETSISDSDNRKKGIGKEGHDHNGKGWVEQRSPKKDKQNSRMNRQQKGTKEEINEAPPYLRVQITLNSLRSTLPIILCMVNHEHRLSKDIKFDPELMEKNKDQYRSVRRSKIAFLFTGSCFDVCTIGELKEIQYSVNLLLGKVLPRDPLPMLDINKLLQVPNDLASSALDTFLNKADHKTGQLEVNNLIKTCHYLDEHVFQPIYKDFTDTAKKQDQIVTHLYKKIFAAINDSSRFRGGTLTVYGSNLSNLSLKDSDVDLSLCLPSITEAKHSLSSGKITQNNFDRLVTNTVFAMKRLLEKRGFVEVFGVHRARVPVVKGRYHCNQNNGSMLGSISFDICFQNERAVVNSTLLREYSNLDERVKVVMLVIKMWVRASGIGSAADGTLSSYSWMNLVVFYLQCIDFVPNLQCKELLKSHHFSLKKAKHASVDGLDTVFLTASMIINAGIWKRGKDLEKLPITALLHGFFQFYSTTFISTVLAVSIRIGKPCLLKTVFGKAKLWRLCIEDPFETHDAHTHHDLGMHIEQKGQPLITTKLQEAADIMKSALTLAQNDKDLNKATETISSLWKKDRFKFSSVNGSKGALIDDQQEHQKPDPLQEEVPYEDEHANRNYKRRGQNGYYEILKLSAQHEAQNSFDPKKNERMRKKHNEQEGRGRGRGGQEWGRGRGQRGGGRGRNSGRGGRGRGHNGGRGRGKEQRHHENSRVSSGSVGKN